MQTIKFYLASDCVSVLMLPRMLYLVEWSADDQVVKCVCFHYPHGDVLLCCAGSYADSSTYSESA